MKEEFINRRDALRHQIDPGTSAIDPAIHCQFVRSRDACDPATLLASATQDQTARARSDHRRGAQEAAMRSDALIRRRRRDLLARTLTLPDRFWRQRE